MLSLLCLLFIGQSLASPSANQYVDTVIHSALQNVIKSEKLEPTHLSNFTFDYYDKTFFGKVHGRAEYSQGSLAGLSQIERYSECEGPKNVSGSTTINCTLTFNRLQTSYKGKVKYGVLPKVGIESKGDVRYTIINVGFAKGFNEKSAQVKSLSFRSIGEVNTTFTGLGPLNKHMKVLEENYKSQVGSEVTNVISNRFRYVLNLAAASVPVPLQ